MKKLAVGIDPGIFNSGWGVVERSLSSYVRIDSGTIHTPATSKFGSRLGTLYACFRKILTEYSPTLMSIESVFFGKNVSSCTSTAGVIAVAELVAIHEGIDCVQVTPQKVKAAVTGRSRASKKEVHKMVEQLLHYSSGDSHESDALACAIAGLLEPR